MFSLLQAMGCPAQIGVSSKVGGFVLWSSFLWRCLIFQASWGFGNCCRWLCGHPIGIRFYCYSSFESFGGSYSHPFSVTLLSFLGLGLVSGWKGVNWFLGDWSLSLNFPSNSNKYSHFLNDCWMGEESCAPWGTFNKLGCPVPTENMCLPHRGDLHFYVYCLDW